MTVLWTLDEIIKATSGSPHGRWGGEQIFGVSIDTRTLERGDLFVALSAARDGHDFVSSAIDRGAAGALVSRMPKGADRNTPLIIVKNVQTALEDLARAARERSNARIVAVTGSVGKTSSKDMLNLVLSRQDKTHAAVASYNNHWGVPLTLARMPKDTAFGVIEIGMNHPDEIHPLTILTRPDVALITTVSEAHLEAFGDISEIAREKASIIDGLSPDGAAVFNADIEMVSVLENYAKLKGVEPIWFGVHSNDMILSQVIVQENTLRVEAVYKNETIGFSLSATGMHFAQNALGVLLCVEQLGADIHQAAHDLADWSPSEGRGTIKTLNINGAKINLIDDAFNANPASLRAALSVLGQKTGRKIAILGDMKELGETQNEIHADIAKWPELNALDQIHTIGPLMSHLRDALPFPKKGKHTENVDRFLPLLDDLFMDQDTVLIKASKSTGLAILVDALIKMSQTPNHKICEES